MGEIRSHAVVLRGRDWREADRMVTLLTRDAGKVTAIARGVKKTKSKFSALVEPLTLGHFLLHEGKTFTTLIQGEIIKPYSVLRADLFRFAYGQYFCELCDRVLPEAEPALTVFTLLVAAMELLEKEKEPARVARCFELSLLDELGFHPVLEGCAHCGQTSGPFDFDPAQGSLICRVCPAGPERISVSGAAVSVAKRFLQQGFHRLSICAVSAQVNREIQQITAAMLANSAGIRDIKSRSFIENLENDGG